MFHDRLALLILPACLILARDGAAQSHVAPYPDTQRVDHTDEYHDTVVPDPYRWLEDDARESTDVAAWVESQNDVTFEYLDALPQRSAIEQRLTELWDYERYTAPFKAGTRYVFSKNDGLQNQAVVYVMDALGAEARVLFDPNTWSNDGTVALAGMSFSEDGAYCAYGVAEAGSDWKTWRVRVVETGDDLPDVIRWMKFSEVTWTHDGRGFFYGRYDEPDGAAHQTVNKNQKLFYHRLGTNQSEDVLVYKRPDEPDWGYGTTITEDGRYLLINIWKGTGDEVRVMYKDLTERYGMPIDLIDEFEAQYTYLGNDGPRLYFLTNKDAPRRRIVAMDLAHPDRLTEIVPESNDTLLSVDLVANLFLASFMQDAKSAVRVYDMTGRHVRDVDLPGIGTTAGFGGKRTDTETFYSFSSIATPPSIYRYDVITGASTLLRQAQVAFDPADYEVKQIFYTSADGTRVPMFIAHQRGLQLDGSNPTLLYGYGGFNIPMRPRFSVSRIAWMDMGGVYAQACLRGGGEYGEEWHQAGMKLNKQNVFDDFIAAAEWLIDTGYTRSEKLAIQGGSNGGLLVGACMTQRPDLFGACLPAVGVMDMLRFHEFTIGWAWTDDYGSSANPEEFETLYAYSPYHNLEPGTAYPATLITTADTDDRVVPGHSFKFAAALQYAQAGDAPVLIRIETRAGHGAGKPTTKRIAEVADQWAFLAENLGMSVER